MFGVCTRQLSLITRSLYTLRKLCVFKEQLYSLFIIWGVAIPLPFTFFFLPPLSLPNSRKGTSFFIVTSRKVHKKVDTRISKPPCHKQEFYVLYYKCCSHSTCTPRRIYKQVLSITCICKLSIGLIDGPV